MAQLPTDITGNGHGMLEGIGLWAANVTNGMFWTFALLVFGVVLMVSTQRFGTPRSFGFAAFSCMLGSLFLAILHFIAWSNASIFIVVGLIGFAVMILNER
jgi:phosphatidylserine synthase